MSWPHSKRTNRCHPSLRGIGIALELGWGWGLVCCVNLLWSILPWPHLPCVHIFLNYFLASILHPWNVPKRLHWRHLLQSTLAKETHTLGSQTYLYIISWCAMLAKLASGLSRNWTFEVCYIAIGSWTQSLGPKASLWNLKTTCNLATWNCPPTQSSPSSLAGLPACRRSFPVKSLSHPTPSKDIHPALYNRGCPYPRPKTHPLESLPGP